MLKVLLSELTLHLKLEIFSSLFFLLLSSPPPACSAAAAENFLAPNSVVLPKLSTTISTYSRGELSKRPSQAPRIKRHRVLLHFRATDASHQVLLRP